MKALLGLSFTLLVPPYWGPDEVNHVDMVKWYQANAGYPDPTEHTTWSPGVIASSQLVSPSPPRPPHRIADAVPRPDRRPFDELGQPPRQPARGNQMSQHPPGFYAAASAGSSAMTLLPADVWSWDRELYVYRLISWLSFVTLPLLAAEAALAVGLTRAFTAVAASFTLLVPMSSFIGAVVSNDGLAMAFAGLAVVGALAYMNRGGTRWALVTAVGCAGAPLTKSTVAPTIVWAAFVVAVAAVRRWGWRFPGEAVRQVAVVGVGTLIGFSWHITNVVRFADPQPNGFDRGPPPGYDASLPDFLGVWIPRVSSSFWGQPARRTGVTLAPWMITSLTVATLALCIYAIVRGRRHRWATFPLALLVAGQVALMFRTNWNAHLRAGRFPALQGRYLFSLLVPLAALVAIAVAARLGPRRPGRAVAVAATIAGAGVALHVFLGWSMLTGGYWDDDGAGVEGLLRAVVAWSPLPAAMTLATFLATAVVIVLACASVAIDLRATTRAPRHVEVAEAVER